MEHKTLLSVSWLKHLRHCAIVHKNWGITDHWNRDVDVVTFQAIAHGLSFTPPSNFDHIQQMISNHHIDAIGIDLQSQRIYSLHMINQNYQTLDPILAQITQTIYLLQTYFKSSEKKIIFLFPKLDKLLQSTLKKLVLSLPMPIEIIANETMNSTILRPLQTIHESKLTDQERVIKTLTLEDFQTPQHQLRSKPHRPSIQAAINACDRKPLYPKVSNTIKTKPTIQPFEKRVVLNTLMKNYSTK
jgi:hypothetical protein